MSKKSKILNESGYIGLVPLIPVGVPIGTRARKAISERKVTSAADRKALLDKLQSFKNVKHGGKVIKISSISPSKKFVVTANSRIASADVDSYELDGDTVVLTMKESANMWNEFDKLTESFDGDAHDLSMVLWSNLSENERNNLFKKLTESK